MACKIIGVFLFLSTLPSCQHRIYQLAYVSDQDNKMNICLTDSNNGKVVNLTNSDFTEYNLTWSANGQYIYYTSYEKSGRKVKCIDIESKTIKTIIEDSTIQSVSDVSKDQKKLLISTTEHNPRGELYLYDLKNQTKKRLTNNHFYEAGAKFSPDEQFIVASIQTQASDSINHSGTAEIFIIEIATLNLKQLTDLKGFNALPEYSPEGKQITFHRCNKEGCDIYVMDINGSHIKNMTQGISDNRWPRWSPDGKWIAFTRTNEENNSDIYFVSRNGKKVKGIITSKFRDEIAVFRPRVK